MASTRSGVTTDVILAESFWLSSQELNSLAGGQRALGKIDPES